MNCVVSLFLLSQVFLIMHHAPLVRQLADIIFHADRSVFNDDGQDTASSGTRSKSQVRKKRDGDYGNRGGDGEEGPGRRIWEGWL